MKELLKQKNVTQTALAKVLKVTVSLVNQWVRGLCEPTLLCKNFAFEKNK